MPQCEGKGAYFDQVHAACVASRRMEKDPSQPPLRAYKCLARGCPYWHITSKPLREPPARA